MFRRMKLPQFDRIASVTVGEPEGEGVLIEGLRINFNVHKTILQDTNTCKVRIYNLSESTHAKIKNGDTLILEAGYSEGSGKQVLFVGTVNRTLRRIRPPDIITDIECYDGEKVLTESRVVLSYSAGASALSVLNQVAIIMNIPIRDTGTLTDKEFLHGFSFAGFCKDALNKLTAKLELTWSIQNNELQFIPLSGSPPITSVQVSSKTGLLSSPEKLDLVIDPNSERVPGWKIVTLLNTQIEPGGYVTIESITANGVFFVNELRHRGDTHQDFWETISEVYD